MASTREDDEQLVFSLKEGQVTTDYNQLKIFEDPSTTASTLFPRDQQCANAPGVNVGTYIGISLQTANFSSRLQLTDLSVCRRGRTLSPRVSPIPRCAGGRSGGAGDKRNLPDDLHQLGCTHQPSNLRQRRRDLYKCRLGQQPTKTTTH